MPRASRALIAPLAAILVALPALAQTPRSVTWSDAARWESLGASLLSPGGKWIAYTINRTSGENELRFRNTAGSDSTRAVAYADQPAFSRDGKWLAYRITVSETERNRLTRANQQVRNKLGLTELATGTQVLIDGVQDFAYNHAGTHIAYRRYAPAGRKSRGTDLVVRDLRSGVETSFGNVAEYTWQDRGALLAVLIDAETSEGNGVQLHDPVNGTMRTLDSHAARYYGLTWRRNADDLVAMRTRMDSAFTDTAHVVIAWKRLNSANPQRIELQADADQNSKLRVVNYRRPRWTEDGSVILLGVKAREPKLLAKASADSTRNGETQAPEVEVWHARDVRPQLVQKLRAAQDRQANDFAAWHIDANRLVRLSTGKPERLTVYDAQKLVLEADDTPYQVDALSGRAWRDLHHVDLNNGQRTQLAERIPFAPQVSSTGRYVVFMKDNHWWSRDLQSNTTSNLTAAFGTSVVDTEDDHAQHHKPPYGIAGWTTSDRSVIIYDRYDLWEVRPDGSAPKRLTNGAEQKIVHRYLRLDPEQVTIDLNRPIYLSLSDEWTRKSGIARRTNKGVETLLWDDTNIGRLSKAEQADLYTYVAQTYIDSPDIFVAGPTLAEPRQVSQTNPFQKDFAWGKAELIEFTNARGERTQAILNYPANYEPGRKYPMVVYIYERLTQNLHNYVVPSERSQYNVTNFTQNGYFVLRPDLTYVPREPGAGTIGGVVPAVKKVVEMGLVDEKRVGVMGHSWGGYGTAYLATHTNGVFAAASAGAALTNLTSFYGYSSENSGFPEHAHFEVGQERMGVSLWEDPDAYIRNSPIFNVHEMTTPLLIEHGDRDGNVDFGQGVELFNAARRMSKNVVMIVYNGENHGLSKKHNQIDYVKKQLEWFGHFLKGEAAPRWITEGIPYLER